MNANELRIGNLVKIGQEHKSYNCLGKVVKWELSNFYSLEKGYNNIEWFEPIPLTEEWLLIFGFYAREFSFDKGSFFLSKRTGKKEYLYQAHTKRFQVKYVHQLQNLFFALTGEELELSDAV